MDREVSLYERPSEGDSLAFSAPVSSVRGVPVVEVRGEVDLATIDGLLEAIGVACSRLDGRPLACVDLRPARFIDVLGVRHLVEQSQAMRELGGELRLIVPEEGPVAHAFEKLGIAQRLELHRELPAREPGECGSDGWKDG